MQSEPISYGSQQLRLFRRAVRDGATLKEACDASMTDGNPHSRISEKEGAIYLAADARNPPPEAAFQLLYDPAKRKENEMAKEDGNEVGTVEGEYAAPKAAEAFKHHQEFIAPKKAKISELTGDCSAPWEHIKKHCHMPRNVMNFLLTLDDQDDDAKQQHMIDALFDGLKHLGFERSRDLVTMAQDGSDLPPGLDDEEEFEASEAELAAQKPRADAQAKAGAEAEMVTAH